MDTTNRCWKQPIPTDLDSVFGRDYVSRHIYIDCLLHARNEPGTVSLNGEVILLQRGQSFITVSNLADSLNRNRKTIRSHIKLLNETYNRMDTTAHRYGFVVTIRNYDEVIKMDSRTDSRTDNQGTPERTPEGHKQECKTEDIDKTEQQQEALSKIESRLGNKYTYKNGKPYFLHKGTWTLIGNPVAFAQSFSDQNTISHNPITSDPDFQRLLAIPDHSGDTWIRATESVLPKLNQKYPNNKWRNEWIEANKKLSL